MSRRPWGRPGRRDRDMTQAGPVRIRKTCAVLCSSKVLLQYVLCRFECGLHYALTAWPEPRKGGGAYTSSLARLGRGLGCQRVLPSCAGTAGKEERKGRKQARTVAPPAAATTTATTAAAAAAQPLVQQSHGCGSASRPLPCLLGSSMEARPERGRRCRGMISILSQPDQARPVGGSEPRSVMGVCGTMRTCGGALALSRRAASARDRCHFFPFFPRLPFPFLPPPPA